MIPETKLIEEPQTRAESARPVPAPQHQPGAGRGDALVVTFFLISFALTCLFCLASAIAQLWG